MSDQFTFVNPVEQYHQDGYAKQSQDEPGLDSELTPAAEHGEDTYRGSGRLTGRRALVTGADSGIGERWRRRSRSRVRMWC